MTRVPAASTIRTALLAVAALGAITLATTQSAEARHRHHGLSIHIGSGIGVGFHHRHRHGGLLLVGGGHRCGWLYRKAVRTGRGYWWDRYEDCRAGY
ncbi:MAG: hypothetical protein HOP09_08445 [Hyphomicrobium sp.]|nr:hypothetical protein [Hyphomicrobium sp.]